MGDRAGGGSGSMTVGQSHVIVGRRVGQSHVIVGRRVGLT